MNLEYRSPAADELEAVLTATTTAFGEDVEEGDVERERQLMPLDRVLAAWDDGRPVGVTASYPLTLTVPGGSAPAAGVTWVGVLPSHRRRGILRELMRRQLDDVHERGEPLAALWASESAIYGRFGYGSAALVASLNARRDAFSLRDDPGPRGEVRLVDADEAATRFPPLYERLSGGRPGFLGRSEAWWRERKLADPPSWRRGTSRKLYALARLDGEDAGYALYRVKADWDDEGPKGEVRVIEALGVSPEATAVLWRFLFGIDLTTRVTHWEGDPALQLFTMVADPRSLHLRLGDGLWVRIVDLEAALAARRFEDAEPVVLEVADAALARNEGRWSVGAETGRTDAEPDVALDVRDLASAYLGAFGFEQLAAAGRARELRPGGLARATAAFRTPLPPFCPEDF